MTRKFHARWFVTTLICAGVSPLAWGDLLVSPLASDTTVVSPAPSATTWHVGGTAKGDPQTIQDAVNAAAAGDIIVLSRKTYSGTGNCDVDLKGKALTIEGADSLDPNTVKATIIDCNGSPTKPHRAFSIVGCSGAVLSGLTITHGVAARGGAVYCQNSTLDVRYCQIVDNATLPGGDTDPNGGPGGGLYCENATVCVLGCFLSGNTTGAGASSKDGPAGAGGDGAAICGMTSEITIVSSTITGNAAGAGADNGPRAAGRGGDGGAFFGNSLRLIDTSVALNAAGAGGQGLPCGRGGNGGGVCAATAVVSQCTLEANRAGDGGKANPGSKIDSGTGGAGGGLYANSLEITDSLITGNRAGKAYVVDITKAAVNGDGGGLWCAAGTVGECTIAGNVVYQADKTAGTSGQGAGLFGTTATKVTGSVLYQNTPDQLVGYDPKNVTYCNVKTVDDATGKAGTIVPPDFVQDGQWVSAKDPKVGAEPNDPNAAWVQGDYRLQSTSPLIDAGDPNYKPAVSETDVAGNARQADAAVDIGAFEFQSRVPLYRFASPSPDKSFYTDSEAEKAWVIVRYADFWKLEGTVYDVFARASDPNLKPVYRFWSEEFLCHFYTISEDEKQRVIQTWPDVWEYDGPVFYAYPEGHQPKGTIPVYRFWSNTAGGHYYTTDEADKNKRAADSAWSYEGIAWYAYAHPQAGATEPNAVYELTGGASEIQCTLTLKALLDGKEVTIDKPEVTFAFGAGDGVMDMTVDSGSLKATLDDLLVKGTVSGYQATVGDSKSGGQVSLVLSAGIMFWGQAAHGPFGVDPNTLMFPTTGGGTGAGDAKLERFTLSGSVTVDGNDVNISLDQEATTFATGAPGALDASALPERLNARLAGTFQWSCPQPSAQPLLTTKTKSGMLQLYVATLGVQTTGVWQGKKSQ
jgi:hypothetical protein